MSFQGSIKFNNGNEILFDESLKHPYEAPRLEEVSPVKDGEINTEYLLALERLKNSPLSAVLSRVLEKSKKEVN